MLTFGVGWGIVVWQLDYSLCTVALCDADFQNDMFFHGAENDQLLL